LAVLEYAAVVGYIDGDLAERRGIRHRYIRPRCPEQNGKVERSHRIDHDEFWSRHDFETFEAAAMALRAWERTARA
jgi:transposase InsO family protein